jgi:tight adherence protein B
MEWLLVALSFVIVLLGVVFIFALAGRSRPGAIIRGRLESIDRNSPGAKPGLDLGLVRDELLSSIPAMHRVLQRWAWSKRLRRLMAQAGTSMRPGKLVLASGVAGGVTFKLVDRFADTLYLSLPLGLVAAAVPTAIVFWKRARRFRAFERLLPEAIELLARSVRAGHSFTTGLEVVATDMSEPLASEFRTTFDEQQFGLPIRDALLNLGDRIPLLDVHLFVTALLVQKETGGNLAGILDSLARVIRERFRIMGEVRVRTAQGRLTAVILIVMPLVMLLLMKVLNPDYVDLLFVDHLGRYMLLFAATLQVIGAAVLWKIVRIKV